MYFFFSSTSCGGWRRGELKTLGARWPWCSLEGWTTFFLRRRKMFLLPKEDEAPLFFFKVERWPVPTPPAEVPKSLRPLVDAAVFFALLLLGLFCLLMGNEQHEPEFHYRQEKENMENVFLCVCVYATNNVLFVCVCIISSTLSFNDVLKNAAILGRIRAWKWYRGWWITWEGNTCLAQ
jgi:hypothetical protein